MKFLISTKISAFRTVANESASVHFCDPGPGLSVQLTSLETVDAWICNGEEVTSELMSQWLDRACHVPKTMLVQDASTLPRLQDYSQGRLTKIATFPDQVHSGIPWEESILRAAEMLYARSRARTEISRERVVRNHDRKTNVLLVGAGIVNLVTAELLAARGFSSTHCRCKPRPSLL